MDNNSFWLVDLNDSVLTVSLIRFQNTNYNVSAIGPTVTYTSDRESFVKAADSSLSDAATQVNLPESEEPDTFALIISPFWVDSDGKIFPDKLKLIEFLQRDLKLSPMGFISFDEAIVEDSNLHEGFPSSFVLVNLNPDKMLVSLIYLGKVKERVHKILEDGVFDPALLENALLELNTESTLPPQIIIFGNINESVSESIKSFPWIGKKNVETFLHFPDIKTYSYSEIAKIYTNAITSQFQTSKNIESKISQDDNQPADDTVDNIDEPSILESADNLIEVSASELGFLEPEEEQPEIIPEEVIPEEIISPPSKPRIILPTIKLPHLKWPSKYIFLYPLLVSPLLLLIPFFFSTAAIKIRFNPYTFNEQISATLDPNITDININQKLFPVSIKTFDIGSSFSISTTGQKIIGDKARGEVVVYNKQDKVQNLNKGTVLTDSKGYKFEIISPAQIASSSSNLDAGVITLGQTRVSVIATDIGPEYNLNVDSKLLIKDFSESVLVAKTKEPITGGSKSQVKAVGTEDIIRLEQKLNASITALVDEKTNSEIANLSGVIKELEQVKKGRTEYNREIGEATDELQGKLFTTVKVYYINPDEKISLLKAVLSGHEDYSKSVIDINKFNLSFSLDKYIGEKAQGKLTVAGEATPKTDLIQLKKLVSGKSHNRATLLIKAYPRVFSYDIQTNFKFLGFINPLPYRLQNINIEVK